ncbi:1-acylglycerol-3-phosphate acyltransferase [Neoconidiobolus thromboides FSU 785]|nr:1-acylglycerol-3-phosphate acyltransferase [Neoconidiobolus thromboides FSU 785]
MLDFLNFFDLKYTTVAILLFISLFQFSSKVRFIVRCIILANCYFVTGFLGVVVSVICRVLGKEAYVHYITGRFFSFISQLFLNVKFNVLDDSVIKEYNGKPAIYIGNHQSTLDVSFLGTIYPKNTAIIVKKSLRYVPFLGQYLMFSNTLMIDRQNAKQAIDQSNELARRMTEKQMGVFVYAEGTRSGFETPDLLPFKKGAFHLAIQTGFPIIPIVYSNTSHIFNMKKWRFESGGMGMKVLPPIITKGKTKDDLEDLMEETHKAMKDCLKEISQIDYSK